MRNWFESRVFPEGTQTGVLLAAALRLFESRVFPEGTQTKRDAHTVLVGLRAVYFQRGLKL